MNEKFGDYKKIITTYAILAVFFALVVFFTPDEVEDIGVMSVIPAAFLLIYIFYTKRILESLMLGGLLGFLMGLKGDFFEPMSDSILEIVMDEDIAWLFIVCGLMGSIIALIEKAGGAYAFGEWVSKRAKTKKSTLMWTWVLGVIIFIDDYLNCLTVGASMSPLTDKHKVPREFLAYIVDSTAAPVCVLVPISTWSIFIGSLMESNGLAPAGRGVAYFIKTIPFNFYGWFAALLVPLIILGIVPVFGPMKKAFIRAETTGLMAPPGSEKIDMKAGEVVEIPPNAKLASFFLPILILVVATIAFDTDMQRGVIATTAFMFVYYVGTGIMGPEEFMDLLIKGLKNMLFPLFMVILAYFFAAACEQIGFMEYAISLGLRYTTAHTMPLVVFITFGITEFIMGISWGMYIIALPIVIPLAAQLGANPFIAVGAVCSAGVWGSHICFYSDATILTSAACGCDNFRHAITQLPFGMVAMAFSLIAFFTVGMLGIGI